MIKRKRTADAEDKKNYYKVQDRKTIKIRVNVAERSLLESMMREADWQNVSGFIKFKLFGQAPEQRLDEIIESKNRDDIVAILRNCVLELAEQHIYVLGRYNKDMGQLYREEGVDVKSWVGATNRWHAELVKRTQEMLTLVRKIAAALGLTEYFHMPSDEMVIDWDSSDTEKENALAAQLRKERIAMGRDVDIE